MANVQEAGYYPALPAPVYVSARHNHTAESPYTTGITAAG